MFWSYYSKEGDNRATITFFATASLLSFCCNTEGDGSNSTVAFGFGLTATKKVTAKLPSPFVLVLLQQKRQWWQYCRCLFFFFCCSAEGDDNVAAITFGFGLATAKNFFCYSVKGDAAIVFFCFGFVAAKKVMAMSCHLLLWFHCSKEKEDNNFRHLFRWLCLKKMAAYTFFGGFTTNKVTVTMSLPSSMVVVL